VEALERIGAGWRAHVRGREGSLVVDAEAVLNCAGPWAGRLAASAGVARPVVRTTRGSHVAIAGSLAHGLVLRAPDGRTFFAVPWNEVTLVGTTDLDEARDPAEVRATAEEVRYLLDGAGAFATLPGPPAYTTAGVRALVARRGAPGAVPRAHGVLDHARDGAPGLFSLVGGKITTARLGAHDAVEAVARRLRRGRRSVPDVALPGAAVPRAAPDAVLGARAPVAQRVLCPRHATLGSVRLAVEQEWCRDLPDFMFRRSLAGHAPDLGAHCAQAIEDAMAALLGWGPVEREAQRRAYEAECATRRAGL
jgi:glycerol-3-phosphate dehydrogenase